MQKRSLWSRVALLGLLLSLSACAHARQLVYLEPGKPVDLKQLNLKKQSLIVPLRAGEVLPLDIKIDGDFVATTAGTAIDLQVKRDCFVRIDDRGLRVSPDHNFDEKPRRKGSFQLGLGVTEKGKRATMQVVTPSRIP